MTWPAPTHDTGWARTLRCLFPGSSHCLRCGLPWPRCEPHETHYGDPLGEGGIRGCFPLCEGCWATLAHPEARIPYYATLLAIWEADKPVDPRVRRAIGQAVANGG